MGHQEPRLGRNSLTLVRKPALQSLATFYCDRHHSQVTCERVHWGFQSQRSVTMLMGKVWQERQEAEDRLNHTQEAKSTLEMLSL